MLTLLTGEDKNDRVKEIAERLLEEDLRAEEFSTRTQEEYDLLFEAIGEGRLPEAFNLGRSGIWLNKKRINPPRSVLTH